MTRARRWGLVLALSVAGLCAVAATLNAQGFFPSPPRRPDAPPVIPGSGGTLPEAFIGTYLSPRADSPEHLVTVTPYGLSSTLCRALDCLDGSVNFSLVECATERSCVFVSDECVGSVTRQSDGALLLTSAPTAFGREVDALGVCTAFAGTARPLEAGPTSPLVEAPAGDPCEVVARHAGAHERHAVTLDGRSQTRGAEGALVTIAEFSDYQCPFCARVQPTLSQVLMEYEGDVRVVFLHNPLAFHREAPLAHQAALAAGEQGRFWEMHDLLFGNQRALDRPSLESYATRLGLDLVRFRAYLDAYEGRPVVDADQALARSVGASGTPTFFVNGRQLTGAQPIEAFRTMINEELALARTLAGEGLTPETIYACLVGAAPVR
jgi:protein-disulfide isomerase